jgi:4-amino-4-deoxy-L-arabinose transferase-like glycosyltransferase
VTSLPSAPAAHWRRDLLLLALLFGALYFFCLGRAPLDNPDEGRYAEIPREMLATGDWVTPRLDGVNYFEKPPLIYWAIAASIRVFGPGEGAVRAIPALFGLGGVLLTYAAARRLYGRSVGLAAAAVLGSSALYAALARIVTLDIGVSVLMTATLCCFLLGVREPPGRLRRWFFYGVYVSAALATLAKGLMGFLLTGAVMVLWLLICRQWRRLRPLHLPTGLLLFLAIAAPWHLLAAARNPTWAHFYFYHEHWERFTSDSHGRFQPWYYFIPILIGGLFPWIGFLGPAVRNAVVGGWARRSERPDRWLWIIWAAFIFLFFSESQSKLATYILPVFPPLAVLIGLVLAPAWQSGAVAPIRRGVKIFAAFSAVLALAIFAAVTIPGRFRIEPAEIQGLRPYASALAAVLVGGAAASTWAVRRGDSRAALAAMLVTILLFIGVLAPITGGLPGYHPSTKALAQYVRQNARPGDRIYFYASFYHDFLYYSELRAGGVGVHTDEVELENDPAARDGGRFIEEPEFLREWAEPGRILVLGQKSNAFMQRLLAEPTFRIRNRLLAQTRDFYLFSNEP